MPDICDKEVELPVKKDVTNYLLFAVSLRDVLVFQLTIYFP